MHGLKTINQLNQLAVDNDPANIEKVLSEADGVRAARGPSKFDVEYAATKARNKIERDKAIANLLGRPSEELISLTRANNSLPSTLETALASRLEDVLLRLKQFEERYGLNPNRVQD